MRSFAREEKSSRKFLFSYRLKGLKNEELDDSWAKRLMVVKSAFSLQPL